MVAWRVVIIVLFLCTEILALNPLMLLASRKKIKKLIKKIRSISKIVKWKNRLAKVPRINPREARNSLAAIPKDTQYDPCKMGDRCLNGGTCENLDGNFFCNCIDNYYGQRCHLTAVQDFCVDHLCQNGAICYSVPEMELIYDFRVLELIRNNTANKEREFTETDLKSARREVNYRCRCARGFAGKLCETNEEEQRCAEEYCLYNGKGRMDNGTCLCECDEFYKGKQCEIILPCRDVECVNGGFCENKLDEKTGIYTAECNCPKEPTVETGAVVEGVQCEDLRIDPSRAKDKLVPCVGSKNLNDWKMEVFNRLGKRWSDADQNHFEDYVNDCLVKGHDATGMPNQKYCADELFKSTFCLNGGECQPWTTKLSIGPILIPHCECPNGTEGTFCERKLENSCDTTLEEHLRGVTVDNRCTDRRHGICNWHIGAKCQCLDGWTGDRCQHYDPCARNPCGKHSACIEIPQEDGILPADAYRCLCDMDYDNANKTNCVHQGTGQCRVEGRCKHGKCVDCDSQIERNRELCKGHERKRGFRCICEPGFIGFSCDTRASVCHENLCENQSECKATPDQDYECVCKNGTSGRLCEHVHEPCVAFGYDLCVNGVCELSIQTVRGFVCNCNWGYEGRDCEKAEDMMKALGRHIMKFHSLTLGLFSVILIGFLLVLTQLKCAATTKSIREGGKTRLTLKDALEDKEDV